MHADIVLNKELGALHLDRQATGSELSFTLSLIKGDLKGHLHIDIPLQTRPPLLHRATPPNSPTHYKLIGVNYIQTTIPFKNQDPSNIQISVLDI